MVPDIYLEVRFRTTLEGGRKTPIKGEFYACPLFVDGSGFDCRLLLNGMELALGEYYEVPIKLLNRSSALPKLHVGKAVILWEGKDIADGKVTRIP